VLVRILLCLVLCALSGCGSNARAPVEDRSGQQHQDSSYTVKRGDTLYSIAFRYGMDFRDVAAGNGITPPYTIYPGQLILLDISTRPGVTSAPYAAAPVASGSVVSAPASPAPAIVHPATSAPPAIGAPQPILQRPTPIYTPEPSSPSAGPAIAGTPQVIPTQDAAIEAEPATTPAPGPATTPAPAETATTPAPAAAETPAATPAPVPAAVQPQSASPPPATNYTGDKVETWRWPTSGSVTRGYSESVHKGIDIGGARGDPIVAVAAGKVVYAGTGIVGFGELVIIKHNDVYLSAYGHNDELLVREGETVTAGQVIARKGSSGTDTVKLHFEIRKEGKPIDPQRLLPR